MEDNKLPIIGNETIIGKETDESIRMRVENCMKEVSAVMEKYGCRFEVNQGVAIMPMPMK